MILVLMKHFFTIFKPSFFFHWRKICQLLKNIKNSRLDFNGRPTKFFFKGLFTRFNASHLPLLSLFFSTFFLQKKAVEPNAVSPPALMILTTLDSQVILLEIEDLVLHTKLNKIKIFLIL